MRLTHLTLLCSACVSNAGTEDPNAAPPIQIGFVEAFSSPFAEAILQVEAISQVAVDRVNAVSDRDVELVAYDNGYDVEQAGVVAQDMVDAGIRYAVAGTNWEFLEATVATFGPADGLVVSGVTGTDRAADTTWDAHLYRTLIGGNALRLEMSETLASRHTNLLLVLPESATFSSTSGAGLLAADLKTRKCGASTCKVTVVTYPDGAGEDHDWSFITGAAMASGADTVVAEIRDTNGQISAFFNNMGFQGTWYISSYHTYAPLPTLLPAPVVARIRWIDYAIPESDARAHLEEACAEAGVAPSAALASTFDAVTLLAIAAIRTEDGGGLAAGAELRALADEGSAVGIHDLEAVLSGDAASMDVYGTSGELAFDARGDVTDLYVVVKGYDSSGAAVEK